ncbi:FAD-dependent thymidylate synthase [bacterium]|nr:FAD-dependent thymidylate synthase [bacterium]
MAQTQLHIELLDSSENALSLIYSACRQCYSPKFSGQILKEGLDNFEKMGTFVKQIVSSGHESPLEHVKFTFGIEGVSRALTHQLVRHRIASYSQQSQRYVGASDFDYVVPPSIAQDVDMKQEYVLIMEKIQEGYNSLLKMFEAKNIKGESAKQDARFVLPQGVETKIVLTMNCRELIHFFQQRCCSRAQWEIRNLAEEMLSICKQKLPEVFNSSGAKCVSLGYCPEGEKFTCGKYPLQKKN